MNNSENTAGSFGSSLIFTVFLISLLWIVKMLELLLGISFTEYGIIPKEVIGLRGIVFSPFIHGDIMHLLSNTIPCFILMMVIFTTYEKVAFPVIIAIHFLSGLLVWLFAPKGSVHIGISNIIYGIAAFLVGSGLFRKDRNSVTIAIVIGMLYGGMIIGFIPKRGISWQGHLSGAAVGVVLSFFLRKKRDHLIENNPEPVEAEKHFFAE